MLQLQDEKVKKIPKPIAKTTDTLTVANDRLLTWRQCDLSHLTMAACTNTTI